MLMNHKFKMISICIFVLTLGLYFFTQPISSDFTKEVEILKKENTFVYINENNPCLSQIKYKEILKGSLFAKRTGRYEMNFQYTYKNFDYDVNIFVDDRYHFADYDSYEKYKNINYRIDGGESSSDYTTFIENYIGDYVYIVTCQFDIDEKIQNKQQMINDTKNIALILSHELIDQYV